MITPGFSGSAAAASTWASSRAPRAAPRLLSRSKRAFDRSFPHPFPKLMLPPSNDATTMPVPSPEKSRVCKLLY